MKAGLKNAAKTVLKCRNAGKFVGAGPGQECYYKVPVPVMYRLYAALRAKQGKNPVDITEFTSAPYSFTF